jgi:hypothetical protein
MQKHALFMLLIAAGAVASVAAKAPTFGDWLAVQADGSQKQSKGHLVAFACHGLVIWITGKRDCTRQKKNAA